MVIDQQTLILAGGAFVAFGIGHLSGYARGVPRGREEVKDDTPVIDAAEVVETISSNGGRARAASLSPERRKEIARLAASARWGKPKPTKKGARK